MVNRTEMIQNIINKRLPNGEKVAGVIQNLDDLLKSVVNIEHEKHKILNSVNDEYIKAKFNDINFRHFEDKIYGSL